jgi:hypothetical protein
MSENGDHGNEDAGQAENAGPSVFVGIESLPDVNHVCVEAAYDGGGGSGG